MIRWSGGEAKVQELLDEGSLERLTSAADGRPWLDRADQALGTAREIVDRDPASAFVVGYDAARHGCTALLVQQGFRPTTRGGHLVIERAVRAQFDGPFDRFRTLRRRRNELEYPEHPGEDIDEEEVQQALDDTAQMLSAARELLPRLKPF
jgi:hypothetical protein